MEQAVGCRRCGTLRCTICFPQRSSYWKAILTTKAHFELLDQLSREGKCRSKKSLSWLRRHLHEDYYITLYDFSTDEFVAEKRHDFFVRKKREIGNLITCIISSPI